MRQTVFGQVGKSRWLAAAASGRGNGRLRTMSPASRALHRGCAVPRRPVARLRRATTGKCGSIGRVAAHRERTVTLLIGSLESQSPASKQENDDDQQGSRHRRRCTCWCSPRCPARFIPRRVDLANLRRRCRRVPSTARRVALFTTVNDELPVNVSPSRATRSGGCNPVTVGKGGPGSRRSGWMACWTSRGRASRARSPTSSSRGREAERAARRWRRRSQNQRARLAP